MNEDNYNYQLCSRYYIEFRGSQLQRYDTAY